jgi:ribosomal protein S27AE
MSKEKGGEKKSKCPKCDSDLHLVDNVGQHYCFSCETYVAPEDLSKESADEQRAPSNAEPETGKEKSPAKSDTVPCPSCGDPTVPVKNVDKFYCYACEQYVSRGGETIVDEKKADEPPAEKQEHAEEELPETTKAEAATKAGVTQVEVQPTPEPAPAPEPVAVEEPAPEKEEIPEAVEEEKAAPAEEVERCLTCDNALTYVAKYDRWYCYKCRKYAPKERPKPIARETKTCPNCGSEGEFIEKYQRWYCWSCQKYIPKEVPAAKPQAEQNPLCAQCGKPTTWIATYERYYCYPCKKYAPKAEVGKEPKPAAQTKKPEPEKVSGPACAYCGKPTTWIAKYESYYCYPCQKYVPKEQPKKAEKVSSPKAPPACAGCGKPTTWIAKYERYYCYPCNKYAPKQ